MAQDTLPLTDELKDNHARNKHCLAAAELELSEFLDHRTKIEEQIAHSERSVSDWKREVEKSRLALIRRFECETDSPLEADVVKRRCLSVLGPIAGV